MNTLLKQYQLWFDGFITIDPTQLPDYFYVIDNVCVTEITPEIAKYNRYVERNSQVKIKTKLNKIDNHSCIPQQYKDIDIDKVISAMHEDMADMLDWDVEDYKQRLKRIEIEKVLFKKHNLYPLLQALFFIINTFKQHNVVWGTGRGSSVSSYILYILEVHDVDSFSFQLPITDFLK